MLYKSRKISFNIKNLIDLAPDLLKKEKTTVKKEKSHKEVKLETKEEKTRIEDLRKEHIREFFKNFNNIVNMYTVVEK